MRRDEKGITMITLIITIIVLLILAGITLGSIRDTDGVIEQTKTTVKSAERESIIEKIEADLYKEKVKSVSDLTKEKLKKLIKEKGYADDSNINEEDFITKDGNYTIKYSEIIGWK